MRYLIARRIIQLGILTLFATASTNFALKGTLSTSVLLNSVQLTDPLAYLQILLASLELNLKLFLGAFVVFVFYAIFAGRAFCSWVCPINLITNAAALAKKHFFKSSKITNFKKSARYFLLFSFLLLSFIFSEPVFEKYSHIGAFTRGVIFFQGTAIYVAVIIFVLDWLVQKNLICSHLCPLGAFYALSSRLALLKVEHNQNNCTGCMKCKLICPEEQVLGIIHKESGFITSGECIRCGRCIEVCQDDALEFNLVNLIKGKV